MRAIPAAVIGAGFVGRAHVEALCRLGNVEVAAIASGRIESARRLAAEFRIPRAVADYRELMEDAAIETVHICTPNALHLPMVRAALRAGKHVVCEKPLALTAAEARAMVAQAAEAERQNATCYNLRFYPLIAQMRAMCAVGELGEILAVQGCYVQDWLFHPTDWSWRLEPAANGISRALADIGSHWCDLAEYVTGLRISALCADLSTFHRQRRRPRGAVETFAGKLSRPTASEAVAMSTEDYAACLLHFGERARGSFYVSQVAAGRKNQLRLEVHGTRASAAWDQERPNQLWIGHRDGANQELFKDPALMAPEARVLADYPGGHAEGYPDTFKQLFRSFYAALREPAKLPDYPQFRDGLRQLRIVEAALASHQQRGWVDL